MDGERTGRRRGRPKGTGRHQRARADEILLDKLADRKAIDPSAKTTVIIKQLINTHTDTGGLRRLQRAFKQNEPGLIAAARERVRARQEAERAATFGKNVEAALETVRAIRDGIDAFDRSPKGQEVWAKLQPWLALLRCANRLSHVPKSRSSFELSG
jgi:hypothetical protein